MEKENEISHTGIIESIDAGIINVKIVSTASCVSCSAKSNCSASDIEEKIIKIKEPASHHYKSGDEVHVILNQSAGLKAVLLGYILPFLVMFFTLIIVSKITNNQGIAGIVALSMLIPYYLGLYFTKNKQKETFSFRLK